MILKKILLFSVTLYASVTFAQNYSVSNIDENLKKNASAVIRKDDTFITINSISSIDFEYHTVKTILNKDAEKLAAPYISYDKGDNISNVKVMVYDAAGNKVETYSKSDFKDYANNSQGTFYSDNRVLVLPLVSTKLPYTVEFTYKFSTENTIFIPDFIPFYNYNVSLEESRLSINNKSGIPLRTKEYPSEYGYGVVETLDSGNSKVYAFKNIPAIDDENLAPEPVKILPKVSFALEQFNLEGKKGDFNTWKDFGSWYYNNLLQTVSASTPEIKAEIAALNLQGSTEEKVKKIFQFMQSKTRYVNVALGIGGWCPMTPEEVQKKGYGDCKGLTNYMKTLLDVAGIPSYYCVINSGTSSKSFDKDFPKMGGNHIILMVPTENGDIWLENTSQKVAFNHLGYSTTNRNVLMVKPTGIEVIDTPIYSPEQNQEKETLKLYINTDKSISGDGHFALTGSQYDKSLMLFSYDAKDQQDIIKKMFYTLNFESLDLKNLNNDRDIAEVSFDLNFKAANYSKILGNSILFRSVPIYSDRVYRKDDSRTLPFELDAFQDAYEIEYLLPAGYEVEEIAENVEASSEFGTYTLNVTKKEGSILVKRVLKIKDGVYPKEKYNDYVAFRNKVSNGDNSKNLITKP